MEDELAMKAMFELAKVHHETHSIMKLHVLIEVVQKPLVFVILFHVLLRIFFVIMHMYNVFFKKFELH